MSKQWKFGDYEHHPSGHVRCVIDDNDDLVAEVWCYESDEANARKIVKAEEMYELLKDVDSIGGEVWMRQRETLLSQIDEEA